MSAAPFTLTIHLFGGGVLTLPCEGFEIVPPEGEGSVTLNWTPVEGWTSTIGYLNFNAVAAIECERSESAIEAARVAESG